jgi:hypothetical protein
MALNPTFHTSPNATPPERPPFTLEQSITSERAAEGKRIDPYQNILIALAESDRKTFGVLFMPPPPDWSATRPVRGATAEPQRIDRHMIATRSPRRSSQKSWGDESGLAVATMIGSREAVATFCGSEPSLVKIKSPSRAVVQTA